VRKPADDITLPPRSSRPTSSARTDSPFAPLSTSRLNSERAGLPVRCDQVDRDVRARGLEEPRGVLDRLFALLRPGGGLLNHGIARAARPGRIARARADPATELHPALRVPRRRATRAQRRGLEDAGLGVRGAPRGGAPEHYAWRFVLGSRTLSGRGTGGARGRRGPSADLAALDRGLGAQLRGADDPYPPGARGEERRGRERPAASTLVLTVGPLGMPQRQTMNPARVGRRPGRRHHEHSDLGTNAE
jgi:hypothetical protein